MNATMEGPRKTNHVNIDRVSAKEKFVFNAQISSLPPDTARTNKELLRQTYLEWEQIEKEKKKYGTTAEDATASTAQD